MIGSHRKAPTLEGGTVTTAAPPAASERSRWVPDVLGMLWVTFAGVAVLLPSLIHGAHLGSYDFLLRSGVTTQPGTLLHNFDNGDLIDAIMPWNWLTWTQVHQGHLPLWNPYNGLGMPLAFNWQSTPLSIPSLIGYLAPLRYAFDVSIVVTILMSGFGTYLLARVLGMGPLSAAYAGTVFELSGPMTGWLGFPLAEVMAWLPWLMLFAVLLFRGTHRLRYISLFAVSLAFAIFSGQPEALAMAFIALGIYLVAWLAWTRVYAPPTTRPFRYLVDLGVATIAGVGLSAPLLLPSLQLTALSNRHGAASGTGLPLHDLAYVIAQGFDGLPVIGSAPIGSGGFFYSSSAAYVGMLTVVLAALALITFRKSRVAASVGTMTLVMMGIVFVPGATSLLGHIPGIGNITWLRALMPMALGFALLGGQGLGILMRQQLSASVRHRFLAIIAVASVILVTMWVFMGNRVAQLIPIIPKAFDISVRKKSFIWPTVDLVVGLLAVIALSVGVARRRAHDRLSSTVAVESGGASDQSTDETSRISDERPEVEPGSFRWTVLWRWVGAALLACETFFLISSGSTPISSSAQGLPVNPGVVTLQQIVGSSRVGFGGVGNCAKLGVLVNSNIFYGIRELGLYDPMIPSAYFPAWAQSSGQPAGLRTYSYFCPVVPNTAVAREWGLGFILEPSGASGLPGTTFVTSLDDEALYRVPASAPATTTAMLASGRYPQPGVAGSPVAVTEPDPSTWTMSTAVQQPVALRLRLTAVPGWSATIDGRPLTLIKYNGIMLEADVPPGHHVIVVSYWPDTITLGLVIAAGTVLGLVAAGIVGRRRRQTQTSGPTVNPNGKSA